MARRMKPETAVAVVGVRGLQIAKFRSRLDRLPTSSGVYDFSRERDQIEQRIVELEAGEDVHVQAWELALELLRAVGLKSGFDRSGPRCFCIVGDELVPEDYERVGAAPADPRLVLGAPTSNVPSTCGS